MPESKELDLHEIVLGPHDHPGFNLGFQGWTGNSTKWDLPEGKDGFRIIGKGPHPTHIIPEHTSRATVALDHLAKRAVFENVVLHAPRYAKSYTVQTGMRSRGTNEKRPVSTVFFDVDWIADEGNPTTAWMGYQSDGYFVRNEFYIPHMVEHGVYAHGYADLGIALVDCTFHDGPRSQCIKAVNRPHGDAYRAIGKEPDWKDADKAGTPYVDDVTIWLERVVGYGYGGTYAGLDSWRGGGFIVLEGSGAQKIIVKQCFGVNPNDLESPGFAMDAIGRYYDVDTGEPVTGPYGNGDVEIEWSGFETEFDRIVRCLNTRSLSIKNSALYGSGSTVTFHDVGKVNIEGCNDEEITAIAKQIGVWGTEDELVEAYIPELHEPVSKGYRHG